MLLYFCDPKADLHLGYHTVAHLIVVLFCRINSQFAVKLHLMLLGAAATSYLLVYRDTPNNIIGLRTQAMKEAASTDDNTLKYLQKTRK